MTPSIASTPIIKRRRWWVALLLQVLWASGYLYLGKPKRLAAYLFFLLSLWIAGLVAPPSFFGAKVIFFTIYIITVAISLFIFVDAIYLSIKSKQYELKTYNRWWIYLLFWICASFSAILLNYYIKPNLNVRTYSIASDSNLPGLLKGDEVYAQACDLHCLNLKRGDIVVFRLPTDERIDYIKRIIGLPGDTVQILNGQVLLNDIVLKQSILPDFELTDETGLPFSVQQRLEHLPDGRSYPILNMLDDSPLDNTPKYQVPAGHYFVMGDNRDYSIDSRVLSQVGYVPAENIYAKPMFIYLSDDLSRIGMDVN